ncbi:MAG: hypothetical protein IT383_25110 [Deltaproteobacteria bacterium]|nr:hypothetical protein [Deltaproteobacteria bacterium]
MSDTPADKVEEVDLDALDDAPAPAAAQHGAPAPALAAGSTTVEEVKVDELEPAIPLPELQTTPWLLVCPLVLALVIAWNVDWRDARVRRETAARRRMKTPAPRRPA